ncbi:hypothetical protein NFD60_12460 (plasmid) [Staphylococcus epidermidis]|nr:hypothetical protein NFD60_12460 [Staphylococcus epidermidis]
MLVVEAFVALMRTAYTRLAVRTPSFLLNYLSDGVSLILESHYGFNIL